MNRMTRLKRGDRTHEGCEDCPWADEDPPKCDGHYQGPVACDQRPDRDRFATPAPLPSGPMMPSESKGRYLEDTAFRELVDHLVVTIWRKNFNQRTMVGAVGLAYEQIRKWPDIAKKRADDAF